MPSKLDTLIHNVIKHSEKPSYQVYEASQAARGMAYGALNAAHIFEITGGRHQGVLVMEDHEDATAALFMSRYTRSEVAMTPPFLFETDSTTEKELNAKLIEYRKKDLQTFQSDPKLNLKNHSKVFWEMMQKYLPIKKSKHRKQVGNTSEDFMKQDMQVVHAATFHFTIQNLKNRTRFASFHTLGHLRDKVLDPGTYVFVLGANHGFAPSKKFNMHNLHKALKDDKSMTKDKVHSEFGPYQKSFNYLRSRNIVFGYVAKGNLDESINTHYKFSDEHGDQHGYTEFLNSIFAKDLIALDAGDALLIAHTDSFRGPDFMHQIKAYLVENEYVRSPELTPVRMDQLRDAFLNNKNVPLSLASDEIGKQMKPLKKVKAKAWENVDMSEHAGQGQFTKTEEQDWDILLQNE